MFAELLRDGALPEGGAKAAELQEIADGIGHAVEHVRGGASAVDSVGGGGGGGVVRHRQSGRQGGGRGG